MTITVRGAGCQHCGLFGFDMLAMATGLLRNPEMETCGVSRYSIRFRRWWP